MFRLARTVVFVAYGAGVLALAAKLPRQGGSAPRSADDLPVASAAAAAADAPPAQKAWSASESAAMAPR